MNKNIFFTNNCGPIRDDQQGYVVLMATIVMSSILVILMSSLSAQTATARLNVLNHELKQESRALARACSAVAALKLALDNSYAGNEIVTVDEQSCHIEVIPEPRTETLEVITTSTINNSVTYWKTTFDLPSLNVVSQTEIIN